jgi:diacylglycerol kinase family enzyme
LIPVRIGVGLMENANEQRYFVLMAGAGLDALIIYNIDAKMKAVIGKAAYWLGGFGQLGRALPEFEVRTNGHQVRCSFALASRVKNYGGDLWIARNASLFSNDFELVLFQGGHTLPYMKYLVGVLTGRLAHMRGVELMRVDSLELDCASHPGIYVQVDGEYAGRLPARLSMVPDSLTLLVPDEFRRKHQNG